MIVVDQMTFLITYPLHGRGAFATNTKVGGTLNAAGTGPGPFYRAPANASVRMPGLTGALAVRNKTAVSINDYAVYKAVQQLQPYFGAAPDGILGPKTSQSIRNYQKAHGLLVDGVIGPVTSKSLFKPIIVAAAKSIDLSHALLIQRAVIGHVVMESGFDPAAVGYMDPYDLGIGQINGPTHPSLSVDDRLNVKTAATWIAGFVDGNFKFFHYDEDPSIAAYNLGRGGASAWITAGRPQFFHGANVWQYIANVKRNGYAG